MGKVMHEFPDAAAARLAGKILSRHNPKEIADAIEILVDVLDLLGGDPDEEDVDADSEANGDERDIAWAEWHTRHQRRRKTGSEMADTVGYGGVFGVTEDDEEDDPSGVCDEDGINTELAAARSGRPGCSISDPDHGQDDLGEDDPDRDAFPAYAVDQTTPLPAELANDSTIAEPFLERVRRERCRSWTNSFGERVWRLPEPGMMIVR